MLDSQVVRRQPGAVLEGICLTVNQIDETCSVRLQDPVVMPFAEEHAFGNGRGAERAS